MSAIQERTQTALTPSELTSYEGIMRHIPDAVAMAKIEAESSRLAHTPEGKFALTYLLATRNLLRPVLNNTKGLNRDLLTPTGGWEYNPQRTIDEVGTSIAIHIARQTTDIPNLWMRVEESNQWAPARANEGFWDQSNRFAIIDPMDMTSSIQKGDRVQTTGIAIYDRQGELLSVGIISLVDDGMMIVDRANDRHTHASTGRAEATMDQDIYPLRVATLTRRMHALRDLPVLEPNNGIWTQDCVSGYAVLSLLNNSVDTLLDPIKGNPWYEFVIWGAAAKEMGFPVTDSHGKDIDIAAVARRAIEKNPDENYRIPFVISRTPEIHKRVLPLLSPQSIK